MAAPSVDQMKAYRKKYGIKSLVNPNEELDETTTDTGPSTSPDSEDTDFGEPTDEEVASAYEADLEGEDADAEEVVTKPQTVATAPTDADAYTPPTREEFDTYKGYKKAADDWAELREAFGNNPTGTTMAYFNAMSDAQKAEFVQAVQSVQQAQTDPMGLNTQQVQAKPQQATLADYDETIATGVEKAVANNLEWIVDGPRRVQDYVSKLVDGANNQLATKAQTYIDFQSAKLEQKVDAVMQMLNMTLEEPTPAEIDALVRAGKPVREAVKELYAPRVQQALAAKKVAEKKTPKTPGNGSAVPTRLAKGSTFDAIAASILGRNLN